MKKHIRQFFEKKRQIQKEIERTEHATIGGRPEVQKLHEEKGSTLLKSGTTIAELIRRPELNYEDLAPIEQRKTGASMGCEAAGRDQSEI